MQAFAVEEAKQKQRGTGALSSTSESPLQIALLRAKSTLSVVDDERPATTSLSVRLTPQSRLMYGLPSSPQPF